MTTTELNKNFGQREGSCSLFLVFVLIRYIRCESIQYDVLLYVIHNTYKNVKAKGLTSKCEISKHKNNDKITLALLCKKH